MLQGSFVVLSWRKALADCVGDPGSNASCAQLKDLYSVFPCPNHLATGQAGLILYPPPNSGFQEKFHPFLRESL